MLKIHLRPVTVVLICTLLTNAGPAGAIATLDTPSRESKAAQRDIFQRESLSVAALWMLVSPQPVIAAMARHDAPGYGSHALPDVMSLGLVVMAVLVTGSRLSLREAFTRKWRETVHRIQMEEVVYTTSAKSTGLLAMNRRSFVTALAILARIPSLSHWITPLTSFPLMDAVSMASWHTFHSINMLFKISNAISLETYKISPVGAGLSVHNFLTDYKIWRSEHPSAPSITEIYGHLPTVQGRNPTELMRWEVTKFADHTSRVTLRPVATRTWSGLADLIRSHPLYKQWDMKAVNEFGTIGKLHEFHWVVTKLKETSESLAELKTHLEDLPHTEAIQQALITGLQDPRLLDSNSWFRTISSYRTQQTHLYANLDAISNRIPRINQELQSMHQRVGARIQELSSPTRPFAESLHLWEEEDRLRSLKKEDASANIPAARALVAETSIYKRIRQLAPLPFNLLHAPQLNLRSRFSLQAA